MKTKIIILLLFFVSRLDAQIPVDTVINRKLSDPALIITDSITFGIKYNYSNKKYTITKNNEKFNEVESGSFFNTFFPFDNKSSNLILVRYDRPEVLLYAFNVKTGKTSLLKKYKDKSIFEISNGKVYRYNSQGILFKDNLYSDSMIESSPLNNFMKSEQTLNEVLSFPSNDSALAYIAYKEDGAYIDGKYYLISKKI